MGKPTEHLDWTDATPANRLEPSSGKKDTGWIYQEFPAGNHLNYNIWLLDQWTKFLAFAFQDFVMVGSNSFNDYATIVLAIAGGKKKLILTSDIEVTAQQNFSLSDGIIIGNGFKIKGTAAIAGAILLISGSDNRLKDLIAEGTHTSGTIIDGIKVSGSRNQGSGIRVNQNGAGGTMTDGFDFSGNDNQLDVMTRQIAGTLTNTLTDTGTDNDYRLVEA